MFDRFSRSVELMKQSAAVLRQDRELMFFPIVSGMCMVLVTMSFFLPLRIFEVDVAKASEVSIYGFILLFYIVTTSVGIFFQAALVSGALERMSGGDPTIGSALGGATRRLGAILLWGLIAGTIGFIIRMIEERSELIGKIVMAIVGAAWSLSTFFVVPILVMEDRSIKDSFTKSFQLIRDTWGESVIGGSGFGLLSFLCMMVVGFLGFALAKISAVLGTIVIVLGWCAIAVYFSALQGVFVAALYLHAADDDLPEEFDYGFVQSAFHAK